MAGVHEVWPTISESTGNMQNTAGHKTGSISGEGRRKKARDENDAAS